MVRRLRRLPAGLSVGQPATLLATWFGSGLLPRAPGTWGSAAALPFAWVLHRFAGAPGLALAALLVFAVGWWASAVYVRTSGIDDPGPVVIDEVAGQWLTLLPTALGGQPPDLRLYALGFILFRLADIAKPWPAGWADRALKGGLGVMVDDVLAAVYSATGLWLIASWLRV